MHMHTCERQRHGERETEKERGRERLREKAGRVESAENETKVGERPAW